MGYHRLIRRRGWIGSLRVKERKREAEGSWYTGLRFHTLQKRSPFADYSTGSKSSSRRFSVCGWWWGRFCKKEETNDRTNDVEEKAVRCAGKKARDANKAW